MNCSHRPPIAPPRAPAAACPLPEVGQAEPGRHRGQRLIQGLCTAMTLAAGIGLQAQAQPGPMEEIIVIGQGIGTLRLDEANGAGGRLGLSALETPASVDLITRREILAKGDYRAVDSVTRTAGISASANPGNGGTSVSSRGFNGHGTTVNAYDGTRLYVTAGTVTFPADTSTLERVEVLRGAGSVINGMGALASTINYVPRSPAFGDSSLDALVAAGSFGLQRVVLGGGAELSDTWAFRLDGAYHDQDGYADRADEQRKVLGGSLLFQPSDALRVKFSLDYADIDAAPFWGTPLIDGSASDDQRKNNYNYGDGFVNYEDLWGRVRVEWDLTPNVTFRNDTYLIDASREWQNLEIYSYNGGTGEVERAEYLGIIHDQDQVGNRFDFLIDGNLGDRANRLSVGAELNQIDLNYLNNFNTAAFDVFDSVPVFGFDPGLMPRDEMPTTLDFTTDSRQYALLFDDVLELTEQLSLVLGGRYDRFEFDRQQLRNGAQFDVSYTEFTWRLGAVYQATDVLSFYAQTSTAADPVTSPITINLANSAFDLSTGRQYEIGMKQQLMDGRAEYTVAFFDITKEGMITRFPGESLNEQIGQQSSDGFEFTFRVNPTDDLSFDMNLAVLDSRYDDFWTTAGDSLSDNTPANVPEKTANLWMNWSVASPVQLGLGLRYVDERYGDDANTLVLPSYTVVDAYANWDISDNLVMILRARNLTDEKDYVLSQYSTNQWLFGDPRAYELSFRLAY